IVAIQTLILKFLMKSLFIFSLICIVFSQSSRAQSIDDILFLLPVDCTTMMTQADKDLLLKSNSVNLLTVDTNESIVVAISQKSDSYMRITYEFTSGPKSFICIEIK